MVHLKGTRQYQGLTLTEVLVSLFLLSLFLLTLEALYGLALREARSNDYYAIAMHQLESIVADAKASPDQDAMTLAATWNNANQQLLPCGDGVITGHYPRLAAALYWGGATKATCQQDHIGLSGCLYLES